MKPLITFRPGLFMALGLLASFSSQQARANSEMRDWALLDGGRFRAEIEEVNEAENHIRLRKEDGTDLLLPIDEFSTLDRAWILEWQEIAEELEDSVKKLGGRIEHFEGKGPTMTTGFNVYHPSGGLQPGEQRPLMILFDPGGKAMRYLLRHMEAAEEVKMTIVTCDVFRNGMQRGEARRRFKEVLPIIQATIPHDPARLFLGGTSGGALRSFNLSAAFPEIPWAGVYSNGGWLGGKENREDTPFPAMRVVMVNGDKDHAANSWMDADAVALRQKGSTISVMAFEGGHQVPPPSVQAKAFKWLLGQLE